MAVVCLVSSQTAIAQTAEYKALVREATLATKSLALCAPGTNAYEGYLAMAKQVSPGISDGRVRQLTDAYMSERMLDITVENTLGYHMKYINAEELKQVIAFYNSPEGQRIADGIVQLQTPGVQAVITNWLQPALTNVLSGKKAKPMKTTQSKEFMQALKRVDAKAHITDALNNMMTAIEPQITSLPNGTRMMEELRTLLNANATTLFAEMYGQVYTTADLNALADFYETPAGGKWTQVSLECTANAGPDGQKIVNDFQQWISEHARAAAQ